MASVATLQLLKFSKESVHELFEQSREAVLRGCERPMLAGASFDELVASNKTSTTASGDQSIIIFIGGGIASHPAGEKDHPSLWR